MGEEGRRRARKAIPCRLRVGPGGVLHQVYRTPEVHGRGTGRRQLQEEEEQGRGGISPLSGRFCVRGSLVATRFGQEDPGAGTIVSTVPYEIALGKHRMWEWASLRMHLLAYDRP